MFFNKKKRINKLCQQLAGVCAKELYLTSAQNLMNKAIYVDRIAGLTEKRAILECKIRQLTGDK